MVSESADSKLSDFLIREKLVAQVIRSAEQVYNEPQFKILSILANNENLTLEDLKSKLDLNVLISNVIDFLEREGLVIRSSDNVIRISKKIQEVLQLKANSDVLTPEKLDFGLAPISDNERSSKKSSKISDNRTSIKSKTSPDFLDTLNFDLKESNIQSRIKSELMAGGKEVSSAKDVQAANDVDDLFDDALGESMEDFLSDFEDIIVVEKKGGRPVISGPLIDILKDQGYIKGDLATEEELQKVPEYDILKIIIKEHPIALNKIEELTEVETLSLVLSNLQADELIQYTNDYQWTISNKVKENLIEFISQVKTSDSNEIATLKQHMHLDSKYERQFIYCMYKLGYYDSLDISLMELMQLPEFAIMITIKNNEVSDFNKIENAVVEMPPVHITRIMTQLESDNRISKNPDGTWKLTDDFIKHLVSY